MYWKYWAKAHQNNGVVDYHLYPYHCLDVVSVAKCWLEQSNTILKHASLEMGISCKEAKNVILFYIALHDLGKLDARFQEFVPEIRTRIQGDEYEVEAEKYDHGSYGYWHFNNEFLVCDSMKAVAGHHGSCNVSNNFIEPNADDELIEMDIQARAHWVSFCLTFFDLNEIPTYPLPSCLAGLCSVSDWIGSSITSFNNEPSDLLKYYQCIKPIAQKALIDSGMLCNIKKSGFSEIFNGYEPRGIQKVLDELPVSPGLTIVESDTGSGKTEFAVSYASQLIKAGHADGIVFGLPTQATANGLFSRLGEAAKCLFPDNETTLAHSKAKFLIPDANGFLHQSNKRAFLGSMSVATIDQILMGVLPVKHQFIRAFGTRKSILILDEIHSFDAYMHGLINQVLTGQHKAYASVILLSATLPKEQKKELLNSYQGKVLSENYPLVSHVSSNTGDTTEYIMSDIPTQKTIFHETWLTDDVLPSLKHINQLKKWIEIDKASVCIICNTVSDAQSLYKNLSILIEVDVDIFHARYTNSDRMKIEKHVLSRYGKEASRQPGLLIATQVVEQSLDLDFDIMISQIAPIEYLMQRMGRLWRHDRLDGSDLFPRTELVAKPLFITLAPPINKAMEDYDRGYSGSGFVYRDIRQLIRTQKYLSEHNELIFPDCYRPSIEYVHSNEPYNNEPQSLTEYSQLHSKKEESRYFAAIQLSNSKASPISDVDPRSALLTRDGEMSVRIVLLQTDGKLYNGGLYNNDLQRDMSTLSLSRKNICGKFDEDNTCYKAVVGRDILYSTLGAVSIGKK